MKIKESDINLLLKMVNETKSYDASPHWKELTEGFYHSLSKLNNNDFKTSISVVLSFLRKYLMTLQTEKRKSWVWSQRIIYFIMLLLTNCFKQLNATYRERKEIYDQLVDFEKKCYQGNIKFYQEHYNGLGVNAFGPTDFWPSWESIVLNCLQSPLKTAKKSMADLEARWMATMVIECFSRYESKIKQYHDDAKCDGMEDHFLKQQKKILNCVLEQTKPEIDFCLTISQTSADYAFCNVIGIAAEKYKDLFDRVNLSLWDRYISMPHIIPKAGLLNCDREILVKNALYRYKILLCLLKLPNGLVPNILEFLVAEAKGKTCITLNLSSAFNAWRIFTAVNSGRPILTQGVRPDFLKN